MPDVASERQSPRDQLAELLCIALRLYDPDGAPQWEEMDEGERDVYRRCIDFILARKSVVASALSTQ